MKCLYFTRALDLRAGCLVDTVYCTLLYRVYDLCVTTVSCLNVTYVVLQSHSLLPRPSAVLTALRKKGSTDPIFGLQTGPAPFTLLSVFCTYIIPFHSISCNDSNLSPAAEQEETPLSKFHTLISYHRYRLYLIRQTDCDFLLHRFESVNVTSKFNFQIIILLGIWN